MASRVPLQAIGWVIAAFSLVFFAITVPVARARSLTLRKSADGVLFGEVVTTWALGSERTILPPGTIHSIDSGIDARRVSRSGGNRSGSGMGSSTYFIPVVVLHTLTEDLRIDCDQAESFLLIVRGLPPGGGPVTARSPHHPWVIVPLTLAGLFLAAPFIWFGRRKGGKG